MFFDKDALHRLKQDSEDARDQFLAGACLIWAKPQVGKTYILAIDPASGAELDETEAKKKKLDPSAAVLLERETGAHCATLHGYFHPEDLAAKAAALGWIYNQAIIVVERSSTHVTIHSALKKWVRLNAEMKPDPLVGVGYPNVYVAEDRHEGFAISPSSRAAILDGLEVAVRTGAFKTHDLALIKEAQLFIVKDEKAQAAAGAHDDRILATAIAWKLISVPVGLQASAFQQPPSIAFERTPASFEGMTNQQGISALIENEQRRWAGGAADNGSSNGWTVQYNNTDVDGF
jgi:hypothetical protein